MRRNERRDKVYAKKGWLYVGIRVPHPTRPGKTKIKLVATKLPVGSEKDAIALRDYMQERVDAKKELGFTNGDVTVRQFAETQFIPSRQSSATWKDDKQRLDDFILPQIGDMPIADVRSRHLLQLFRHLTASTLKPAIVGADPSPRLMAPRTVLNIYSVTRALFREAKLLDLTSHQPCDIPSKYLPEKRDKVQGWRAAFKRKHLRMLFTDERLGWDDRVMHAVFFFGGMRISEVCGLQFKHLKFGRNPLGRLLIVQAVKEDGSLGLTKTKIAREMPMHPTFRRILLRWKKEGFEQVMGRPPTPDDFVVPVTPKSATNFGRGRRRPVGTYRTSSVAYKRWAENLELLDIPHKRDHDMRLSLITLAVEDGATLDVVERCTHTPKTAKAIQLYNAISWKQKCRHIGRLKLALPKPPKPPQSKPQLAAVGAPMSETEFYPDFTQPKVAGENQGVNEWRRRESNPPSQTSKNSPRCPSSALSAPKLVVMRDAKGMAAALQGNAASGAGKNSKTEAAEALADVVSWLERCRLKRESPASAVIVAKLKRLPANLLNHPQAGVCIDLALEALEALPFTNGTRSMRTIEFLVGSALRRFAKS